MNKVIYKTSNLFSMKRYDQSDTLCQSYEYPTIYAIRCAIVGAIIQVDGVEKAEDLFYKIKNSNIYMQYPEEFYTTTIKQSRIKFESRSGHLTTMGAREYLNVDKIIFYIDDMIPNIETYLKNIDWLGNSTSMVYLDKIDKVDKLDNVLLKNNESNNEKTYIQHDWNSKTKFENIYAFSEKYKHVHDTFLCQVGNLVL